MASDDGGKLECILAIDTSVGWEISVTKVLSSFQDLSYEINPSMGFVYVKGKTDPQIILKNLKKGGKHATIQWVSCGPNKDDQQQHAPESGHNYLYGHDPYYHFRDPCETYYQRYPPYYPWYSTDHLAQNALHHRQHGPEHEPSRHSGRRSSRRSHHYRCPLHLHHHHHMPAKSHHRCSPAQNSSTPSVPSQATDRPVNKPTSQQPSPQQSSSGISIKKVIGKFCSSCLWLCYKK